MAMNREYLSDIIYCTTQYLSISDKECAILNGVLLKAIWDDLHTPEEEKDYVLEEDFIDYCSDCQHNYDNRNGEHVCWEQNTGVII